MHQDGKEVLLIKNYQRRGDLPFLIREHCRKYQLVITEVFLFIRRQAGSE